MHIRTQLLHHFKDANNGQIVFLKKCTRYSVPSNIEYVCSTDVLYTEHKPESEEQILTPLELLYLL